MIRRLCLVLPLTLFSLACPEPESSADAGVPPDAMPEVLSLAPMTGPRSGGTEVVIQGNHFANGASVAFGGVTAAQTLVEGPRKIRVFTPPYERPGVVTVTVTNPAGTAFELPNAFTYEEIVSQRVEEAVVLNALHAYESSGAHPATLIIRAAVEVPASTPGAGQGPGVRAQVGWATSVSAPVTSQPFQWVDATYDGDADGAGGASLRRDRYVGQVTVSGATGAEQKTYFVAARFSVDNGETWTLADHDGAANGLDLAQVPQIWVTRPLVDWCKLGGQSVEAPADVKRKVGQPGFVVYSQVYKKDVTDQAGAGANIVGQLGYGPAGSGPSTWTWINASYNVDTSGGANDEYQATLPNPGAGSHQFAFRYAFEGGAYRYCDANGDAFTMDQAGKLTVTPLQIDKCVLQHPSALEARTGRVTQPIYGRVWADTVTNAAGAGAGITAELGYGPPGAAPTEASWSWTTATYNVETSGGGEEYRATLTGPAAGSYHYAYRFQLQSGPWTYCDLDGSENGFTSAQAGAMSSQPFTAAAIQACWLSSVDKASAFSGERVTAFGRVKVPGVTEAAGAGAGIRGQVGVGTQGDDASTSSAWGWKEATFHADTGDGEDEYRVELNPAYTGDRAVSFRFSVDNGASWVYCDLNGSTPSGGYEAAQQHALHVTPHADLDFCNLQFPATVNQAASGATTVYGRVYESGLTPGASGALSAWLGYGPKARDPGLAWTWKAATFGTSHGNDDEFQATFSGVAAGQYSYAFRFQKSGSTSYCFGDLDGAGGAAGFNGENGAGGENLGAAVVSP